MKYGLDAGRILTIDGKAAMILTRACGDNAPLISPSDADILAHRIVNALNDMELRRARLKDNGGSYAGL